MTSVFDTRAEAQLATIPAADDTLIVNGYSNPGDGGAAVYKRISVPSPARAWHFQSAGGAWWELAEREVVPEHLGAVGDGVTDNTTAIQAMLDSGFKIRIPKKTYKFGVVYIRSGNQIDNEGFLDGEIRTETNLFGTQDKYVSVTPDPDQPNSGDYPVDPDIVGQGTVFTAYNSSPGFSNYNPGDWVAITTRPGSQDWSATRNQVGYDFRKVKTASAGQLELEEKVRWLFKGYQIVKLAPDGFYKVSGTFARGTTILLAGQIAGGSTAGFHEGELWRWENTDALDCPWVIDGSHALDGFQKAYFTVMKVKKVTVDQVEFESDLPFEMANPVLVRTSYMKDISLKGGSYKLAYIDAVENFSSEGGFFGVFGVSNFYRMSIVNPSVKGPGVNPNSTTTPKKGYPGAERPFGVSLGRYGQVIAPLVSSAYGETDNAACKANAIQDVVFTSINAWDTYSFDVDEAQVVVPVFLDFFFTPYSIWSQNVTIQGANLSKPRRGAGYSLFCVGTRDCVYTDIVAQGQVRVIRSANPTLSNVRAETFFFDDIDKGGSFQALRGGFIDLFTGTDTTWDDIKLTGPGGLGNRVFNVRSASPRMRINRYQYTGNIPEDVALWWSSPTDAVVTNCSDTPGRTGSSFAMTGTPSVVHQSGNRWAKAPTVTGNSNGEFPVSSDLRLLSSSYARARVILGNWTIWPDAQGNLRRKAGAAQEPPVYPSSATDGEVIASVVLTGTATPVGAVTPNFIGQTFVDTTAAVAYVATGSSSASWKQTSA